MLGWGTVARLKDHEDEATQRSIRDVDGGRWWWPVAAAAGSGPGR